jgi:hypothetical protein
MRQSVSVVRGLHAQSSIEDKEGKVILLLMDRRCATEFLSECFSGEQAFLPFQELSCVSFNVSGEKVS